MKNTFRKILAVGMTLALVSSFFAAVPVSAAPGCNAWDDIPMPVLAPDTEPGVMDIAPDGTMFLALYYEGDYTGSFGTPLTWDILYSEDGGFNWKKTNLTGIVDHNPNALYDFEDGGVENALPVRIQVSPMWPDNKNVYVALSNGKVWRLPNAGLGTPALLKPIVSNNATYLEDMGWALWDMDIWADGTYNYLAVATDLDVFVIKDQLLNNWEDYELNDEFDADSWDYNRRAVEVRFAPDFATSELIWAVVAEWDSSVWPLDYDPTTFTPSWDEDDLILTSADSPARWGYVFSEIPFEQYDNDLEEWTPFVDMEFDPAYTSQNPQVYVAIAQAYWNSEPFGDDGNLYLVTGEASSTGPGETFSSYIFFEDRALGTVEVSGNTIMVQDSEDGTVYTTTDGGANWVEATRSPAANFWGQLFMSPNYEEDQTVFSTVMDGNQPWAGVGGVYRSMDGGKFFDGISMLDMEIEFIQDLAFSPVTSSQPVLMLVEYNGDTYIFYTPDATAVAPQWFLKDNEEIYDVWDITMISWDEAGDTVMFMGKEDPYEIYRSTDNGNSFKYWRTVPTGTIGMPKDWVVVDYSIVNVIGDDGYWGTRPVGTPITSTAVNSAGITPFVTCTIDRYVDGSGNVKLAVGMESGAYGISTDNGATWTTGTITGADEVYVAFGPDGTLYAATNQGGRIVKITSTGAVDIKDSNANKALAEGFSGIWVSPDNTLYAMGEQIIPGSTGTQPEAYGSVQLFNDTFAHGTATLDLEELEYVIENEGLESDSSISFSVISGLFKQGEILYVVGDDLVFHNPEVSDIYLEGDILVQGAESGAFGRISLYVSTTTADYMVVNGGIEYSDGFADLWPEDGISVSISSSTLTMNYEDLEDEADTQTTMFRLLLGDASSYNVWETKDIDGAEGLWGTVGSNIAWTVVYDNAIWAFEDFNSGAVQGVNVTEVNKSPATATKDLKIDWTALACTTCYTIWIDGEPYTNVTVASTTSAGATLTKTLTGFDYATEYEVQVQACVDGPLQSRLSAVDDVTTECYLLAPVPLVPNNGMQDASIAPSFVWDMPVDGCDPISYDFQLATDAGFNNIVVSTNITGAMGYTYTARDLDYDTNHYWRVRSVYGSLKSAWSPVQNFHTMLEPQPPVDVTVTQAPDVNLTVPPVVTVPPAQTITVSVPPAVTLTQTVTSVPTPTITMPEQPTPAYIWVIVAVGAILTIAVIVLIIRTRRAE